MRLGIDIGGTFTDILAVHGDGRTSCVKVPSTPENYGNAIREGLRFLIDSGEIETSDIEELIHGTTVAANAILCGSVARTGLITTKGFRDVLEIGRLRTPRLYDLGWKKPPILVPRYLRFEVTERVRFDGTIAAPLDEDGLQTVIDLLVDENIESIAVCLLNAYVNPVHEKRIGEILRSHGPWDVTLSHEVLPEIKEFERTSTTVINACVIPVVRTYLETFDRTIRELGLESPFWIMQSGGGITDVETASRFPVRIIESGPAAGVVAAAETGKHSGYPNVIAFDMGGTTAKASLVENGIVPRATDFEIGGGISLAGRLMGGGGYPVRTPCVDLAEIGAGGGSLLRVDEGGVLQVGPESAGADPGPVSYRKGGQEPTLTDANLVLGYLNPDGLAGGTLPLDRDIALDAIGRLSTRLGLSVEEAALGAHRIGVARMVRAVRAVSSERGRDPRNYVLFASGGSGPLHAVSMADELGIPIVVVPPAPGLFSTFGLLAAPLQFDAVKSSLTPLSDMTVDQLTEDFAGLDEEALSRLPDAELLRTADLRYVGQSHELSVPVPAGPWEASELVNLGEKFEQRHEQVYGHRSEGDPIEIVAFRIQATIPSSYPRVRVDESASEQVERPAYFGSDLGWIDTAVLRRAEVRREAMAGPMIVEDYDATTLVPPGASCRLDGFGNILIERDP